MSSEYAREPVPEAAANRPAVAIAVMVSSAAMGVPVMILGCSIGSEYGAARGLLVIALGCAVTAALCALIAHAGVRSRLSTALLARQAFGSWGAYLLNFAIAIALLGWFSVEMGFVGSMVAAGVKNVFGVAIGPQPGVIVASLLICAICIVGIRLVLRAPMVFLPLLTALLLAVIILTFRLRSQIGPDPENVKSIGTGVSSIVGSYIVGCLISPDYSRFVRTSRAAATAMIVALGPVYAAVLGAYALAGLATHAAEPNTILLGLGLPGLVGLLLPIGLMQNGIMCLYSSSLATSTIARSLSFRTTVIGSTIVGLGLALAGAATFFVSFLVILGIVFPPAVALLIYAGVTVKADERAVEPKLKPANLAIWGLGISSGVISEIWGYGVTQLAAFDGFLGAAIGCGALHYFLRLRTRLAGT